MIREIDRCPDDDVLMEIISKLNDVIRAQNAAELAAELAEPALHIKQHSNGTGATATLPLCSMCECKSADCAYGDLRGSQSCYDTRQHHHC